VVNLYGEAHEWMYHSVECDHCVRLVFVLVCEGESKGKKVGSVDCRVVSERGNRHFVKSKSFENE
jgi:hypothetical protein